MNSGLLVTGATGFVGKHLISLLRNRDIDYETFKNDLSADYKLQEDNNIRAIIHLAGLAHNKAKSVDELKKVNYFGTLELAKKAKSQRIKRFVFLSTAAMYGNVQGLVTESSPLVLLNEFARLKRETEIELLKLGDDNFEVVIIRAPLIYGSEAPANFKLLTKLVGVSPLLPFKLSKNKRSYVAVQNVVDLLLTCADHPKAAQQIFLIADSGAVTIYDLTQQIALMLGKRRFQLPVPITLMRWLARIVGKKELANALFGSLEIDTSKANELLGWSPKFTMQQTMISNEK